MEYSTKEDLLRRREAIPCQDIELPEGGRLKLGPLLPEVRARFPQKNSWEKLLLTLHFGIQTPQLSLRESAEFVNLFPLRAVAVGRKILQLSAEYDRQGIPERDETDHFFAALEGIAERRRER